MYWIQMKEELGEESNARSNSDMVDGRESSGAVAARSIAPFDFDLDFLRDEEASASSEEESDADGAGEGARPDQSNPPDTFSADAVGLGADLTLDLVLVVGGTAISTCLISEDLRNWGMTYIDILVLLFIILLLVCLLFFILIILIHVSIGRLLVV